MANSIENKNGWIFILLFLMAILVNLSGLLSPVWGVDATLYASISKTMVLQNNYVELFSKGKDWLDKPHFPFWVVAIFFKLFGFTSWAYKLPAILFVFMGAGYTFLLAKTLYNKEIALWAALILLTAQHIVISNNDVRAEPYLVGLIIASVYHFYKSYTQNNHWHLITACLFTACAVMTKGVFALIPIGAALAGELIIKRQWKILFNWRWLLALILIAVFVLPEIYCLYLQFDAHPEKTIFGSTGVSGIRFFFWDSQFGRFFNTGPIKGSGEITFFLHTILWAFLPWAVLWYLAVYNFFKKDGNKFRGPEWLCISASLSLLLVFSVSKFQLPHYIIILFSFFAITTAQYIYGLKQKKSIKALQVVQYVVAGLMLLTLMVLNFYFKPQNTSVYAVVAIAILSVCYVATLIYYDFGAHKILVGSVLVSLMVHVYFNLVFYPSLLKYESGTQIGQYINRYYPKNVPVITSLYDNSDALMFCLNRPLNLMVGPKQAPAHKESFLFVGYKADVDSLISGGFKVKEIKTFDDFHITSLNRDFIHHQTRKNALTVKKLVQVY